MSSFLLPWHPTHFCHSDMTLVPWFYTLGGWVCLPKKLWPSRMGLSPGLARDWMFPEPCME